MSSQVPPPPPVMQPVGQHRGPQHAVGPYPPAGAWGPPVRFAPPAHPRATLAMVLGIVAVAGYFVVLVTSLVAPLAWYFGTVALRDMEREPGRWTGQGPARAGQVLGAVGSALLTAAVLGAIAIAVLVTVAGSVPSPY